MFISSPCLLVQTTMSSASASYLLQSFNYFGGLVFQISSQTVLTFCKRDLEQNSPESHYKCLSTEMRREERESLDISADKSKLFS